MLMRYELDMCFLPEFELQSANVSFCIVGGTCLVYLRGHKLATITGGGSERTRTCTPKEYQNMKRMLNKKRKAARMGLWRGFKCSESSGGVSNRNIRKSFRPLLLHASVCFVPAKPRKSAHGGPCQDLPKSHAKLLLHSGKCYGLHFL